MYRDLENKKEETHTQSGKAHGQKHVILYPFFKNLQLTHLYI